MPRRLGPLCSTPRSRGSSVASKADARHNLLIVHENQLLNSHMAHLLCALPRPGQSIDRAAGSRLTGSAMPTRILRSPPKRVAAGVHRVQSPLPPLPLEDETAARALSPRSISSEAVPCSTHRPRKVSNSGSICAAPGLPSCGVVRELPVQRSSPRPRSITLSTARMASSTGR